MKRKKKKSKRNRKRGKRKRKEKQVEGEIIGSYVKHLMLSRRWDFKMLSIFHNTRNDNLIRAYVAYSPNSKLIPLTGEGCGIQCLCLHRSPGVFTYPCFPQLFLEGAWTMVIIPSAVCLPWLRPYHPTWRCVLGICPLYFPNPQRRSRQDCVS